MSVMKLPGMLMLSFFIVCLLSIIAKLRWRGDIQKFGLESMEVTDEIFESKYSVVFKQA
jgi:ornithine carbamoyltransferase